MLRQADISIVNIDKTGTRSTRSTRIREEYEQLLMLVYKKEEIFLMCSLKRDMSFSTRSLISFILTMVITLNMRSFSWTRKLASLTAPRKVYTLCKPKCAVWELNYKQSLSLLSFGNGAYHLMQYAGIFLKTAM